MTVSYNLDVASSNTWTFLKIILRWRGSVWKSVLKEFCAWTLCYYGVMYVYRCHMNEHEQRQFALLAHHYDQKLDYIPLTFMLGFFVNAVVTRWRDIFANIGFIDNPAHFISAYIRGTDADTQTVRRNIVRYLCLAQVLVLRDISVRVRKRFPNLEAIVDAGFLLRHEVAHMDAVDNGFPKYWVPVNWVFSLAYEQRAKGKITADVLLNSMLQEIRTFRTNLQNLCNYDWVPIPLAYPQVVFLVVRLYFIGCLISRQYIITENVENTSLVDLYVPVVTMVQLVLCVGWVKVAESMLNPFGDDDDDFEANYVIDRNLTIAMSMVDACKMPPQIRDNFHDGDKPLYSAESASIPIHALLGSASSAVLEEERQRVRMVPHIDHIPPRPGYRGLHNVSQKLRTCFRRTHKSQSDRDGPATTASSRKSSTTSGFVSNEPYTVPVPTMGISTRRNTLDGVNREGVVFY